MRSDYCYVCQCQMAVADLRVIAWTKNREDFEVRVGVDLSVPKLESCSQDGTCTCKKPGRSSDSQESKTASEDPEEYLIITWKECDHSILLVKGDMVHPTSHDCRHGK
jgi:hypothetical protein